jgi:diguanylate cyclase (GGDEF)-like protein
LKKFANVLKSFSRREDVFLRWGGDEFLLILPETKKNGAEKLMERIKMEVERFPFEIKFSFGIIESEGKKFSSTVKEVSQVMQRNKEQNKRAML